jgi:hypothetical protein
MKLFRSLAVFTIAMLAVTSTATVQSALEDCQAQVAELQSLTNAAPFTGKNATNDQAGLLEKLVDARVKLDEGKPADAVVKLTQFRDKAAALAAAGKLNPEQAGALVAGADQAIACVQSHVQE